MAAPRRTAAERKRETQEQAQKDARLSMRLGLVGVVVLFVSGFGTWLLPGYVYGFLGGLVLGIVLIVAAFVLVRGSVVSFTGEDETKIY